MTIPSESVPNTYAGTGAIATYVFTFPITSASDIRVTERTAGGNQSIKTLNVDYTVPGTTWPNGGTVTRSAGNLPSGSAWIIEDRPTATQNVDLPEGSRFSAPVIEAALDRLTRLTSRLANDVRRCFKVPSAETSTADLVASVTRAGATAGFDASGNLVPIAGSGTANSSTPGPWDLTPVRAAGSTTYRTLSNRAADTVNVKDYGALGDGTTSDSAAIQAAYDACVQGGSVWFPAGVYAMPTAVTGSKGVEFIGAGATIKASVRTVSPFTIEGTFGVSVSATIGAVASEKTTITSALTVAVGDIVKLLSDDLMPYRASGSNYRIGQLFKVVSVGSGTFEIGTKIHQQGNYLTNVRVAKMTPVRGLVFDGLDFVGDGTQINGGNSLINIRQAENPIVRNCTFSEINYICVAFRNVFAGVAQSLQFRNLWSTGTGYGVQWIISTGLHANCTSSNLRHHTMVDGYFISTAEQAVEQTVTLYSGWSHDVHVVGCYSYGATASGTFDFHGGSIGCIFNACHANDAFGGFEIRGWDHKIIGCTATGCNVAALIFSDTGSNALAVPRRKAHFFGCSFEGKIPIQIAQCANVSEDNVIFESGELITNARSTYCILVDQGYGFTIRNTAFRCRMQGQNFWLVYSDATAYGWAGVIEGCTIDFSDGPGASGTETVTLLRYEHPSAALQSFRFVGNTIRRAGKALTALFDDSTNIFTNNPIEFDFTGDITGLTQDFLGGSALGLRAYALKWRGEKSQNVGNQVVTHTQAGLFAGVTAHRRNGHQQILMLVANTFGASINLSNLEKGSYMGQLLLITNTDATFNAVLQAAGAWMDIGAANITIPPKGGLRCAWNGSTERWVLA